VVVGVLHPDHGDPFLPRLLDQAADIRDDGVACVRFGDDAVLHIDDQQCGVRPVLECGHGCVPVDEPKLLPMVGGGAGSTSGQVDR
jgi:hypothetical protein